MVIRLVVILVSALAAEWIEIAVDLNYTGVDIVSALAAEWIEISTDLTADDLLNKSPPSRRSGLKSLQMDRE